MDPQLTKCKFHEGIDVITMCDDQIDPSSPLSESAATLVRLHWNSRPTIAINRDQAIQEAAELGAVNHKDYMTFIEAVQTVHYLEDHTEVGDEEQFMADLYGTALCVLQEYKPAANIGMTRLESLYDTDVPMDQLLTQAINNLNE